MDISPRQEPRHTHDSLSPTLFPSPSSHQHHPAASSNSHLATLLAEAYRDAESLRKELSNTRRALEKAERVYQLLEEAAGSSSVATGTTPTTTTATTPPTTNGDQQQQQQQQQQKYHHLLNNPTALRSVIDQYEKLLAQSQADRARAEERQREALDAVRMLDDLLSALDKEGKAVTRPILEAASMLSPSLSTMRSMAPPPGLPNSRSRAAGNSTAGAPGSGASNAPGRLAPFSLPPHPTPIRTHSPSGSTSSRRPRTPSVDSMYGAAAPPNKKARPAGDDPSTSRGREPRVAYSEPYIPGEYNNRPILPLPQRSSAASESMAGPRSLDANNNNKYNINGSGGGAANHQRRAVASTHRPNHARSESHSSASSMDVDEMIFKATVGDENMNNGVVNGRHPAYTGSPHHGSQHLMNNAPTMTRAGTKRALMMGDEDALSAGTESPRGRALSLSNNHSPYPGGYPPSNASSSSMRGPIPPGNNANSNGGGAGQGNQGSAGGSGSSSHVYTTHVFAPPMTGAPTKKPKFPNSVMGGGASSSLVGSGGGSMGGVGGSAVGSMSAGMGGGGRGGSSPGVGSASSLGSVDIAAAATSSAAGNGKGAAASNANAAQIIPSAPFPATNERGQRICRQCGIVGRYKEGKCVEKWGPGPCGPGTVCDRCRKKMKRVERRGTLEQQQLQLQQQQQQQLAFQARAQAQQHQPTPASHAQLPLSQGSDRSVQRSDTLITADASLGPGAFAGASGSRREESSLVAGNSTSSNATVRPGGSTSQARIIASAAQRLNNQPPPPSIASLRERYGDEDDDEDEEDAGASRVRGEAGAGAGAGDDVEDEIDEFLLSADRDQPPLSNIGRGSAVAASAHSSSRSSSRNGVVRLSNGAGGSANNAKRASVLNAKASPLGTAATATSRAASDADAEAEADDGEAEAEAEILGAIEAVEAAQAVASASASGAGSARGDEDDEDEEEGGDGEDGSERGLLGDGDPDAELLEAVDAAEANSSASSAHGGGIGWMKSEN